MKAKTKMNFISVLSAVISVVFALCVGVTFCAIPLIKTYKTPDNFASAYMAGNYHTLINDTLDHPIRFGSGGNTFEIALQYSYTYDFDIRMEYSLSWSGGGDVSNVKLNFADPDKFIFDNRYIYYTGTVSRGFNKLTILNSVQFADESDENYFGKTLTISISNLEIRKIKNSYSSDGDDWYVSSSPASVAWFEFKSKSIEDAKDARVIVYNSRYDYAHGVDHPIFEGAYVKYNEVTDTEGSYYATASWIGGNKYYSGTGLFVVAGDSDLGLEIEVAGAWVYDPSKTAPEGILTPETNIQFNFASDWTQTKNSETGELQWSLDDLFPICHYNYKVKAGTTQYIDILESLEITSAAIDHGNYAGYRLIIDTIIVNGVSLTFDSGIKSTTISNVSNGVTSYKPEGLQVYNTSLYNAGLYTSAKEGSSSNATQDYTTTIIISNPTNKRKSVTITGYKLKYYYSNGAQSLFINGERAKDFNSSALYTEMGEGSVTVLNTISSLVLEPYSAIEICSYFLAPADLSVTLNGRLYDLWLQCIPVISANTSESVNIVIETEVSESKLNIYAKNVSSQVVNGFNWEVDVYLYSESTSQAVGRPVDWYASFWKYYTDSSATNQLVTPVEFNINTSYYLKSSLISIRESNSFSGEYVGEVYPNERLLIETKNITGIDESVKNCIIEAKASASSVKSPDEIKAINVGSKDAYIINYSGDSYAVTMATENVDDFETIDGTKYYKGLFRPKQILPLNNNDGNISFIDALDDKGVLRSVLPETFKNKVMGR